MQRLKRGPIRRWGREETSTGTAGRQAAARLSERERSENRRQERRNERAAGSEKAVEAASREAKSESKEGTAGSKTRRGAEWGGRRVWKRGKDLTGKK